MINVKLVFESIVEKFKDIEISIFGTGIHDPKSEKEFNLDKIRKIMEVNYFGTMNSINSVYSYYNNKKRWPNIYHFFCCWV